MSPSRVLSVLALGLALAAPAAAQEVPYEKYRLANGMTVILHVDRSLPRVVVDTWFRVGSKDEPPRRSGFAHLFEHLMFMGTERVPEGQFDALMEAGGGHNNASTSNDRTNYYSQGPAELLPTLLWLDADRLEDLGRMMTQEKLDLQRDVVRNERRQNTENVPYGRVDDLVMELLFPPGHPYHHSVIGTHEDLEAAELQDVKDFFANFYVPNNASLVVAGDFDPEPTKALIERFFGTLPRGAEPVHAQPGTFTVPGVVRRTITDDVQLPLIRMAWLAPPAYQDGDAEMDMAGTMLGEGKSARLYTRLVRDEQLAVEVDAGQVSLLLGSVFMVEVKAKPGADLEAIERIVDEELARLAKEGPSAEEVERVRSQEEASRLARMQSLLFRADQMNEYEFYFGEPDSFRADLERFKKASAESIRATAARVLDPARRVVLRVLPDAPAGAAKGESPRDVAPDAFATRPFAPPAPETFTLENGVEVAVFPRRGVPLVHALAQLSTGRPLDPQGAAGRTALLADMMSEGAAGKDAEQFAAELELLGARLDVDAEPYELRADLVALRRNLEASFDRLADALLRANLEADDFQRARELRLASLRQDEDEPSTVARRTADRVYFGAEHPLGTPSAGTLESVAALELDDVRAAREELLRGGHLRLVLVGDVDAQAARALAERAFGALPASDRAPVPVVPQPALHAGGPRVVLVHRPGAVQTVVRFVSPGVAAADPRRVPYGLLQMLLGGSFTSRLNQNLREDKGYTYGAGTSLSLLPGAGTVTSSASVRADVTGASLHEFLAEFRRLRGGDVDPGEAEKARASARTRVVSEFESYGGIARRAASLALAGLDFETVAKDLEAMGGVDAAALNALAPSFLDLEHGVLVLVGDRDRVAPQLEGLGLPPLAQ